MAILRLYKPFKVKLYLRYEKKKSQNTDGPQLKIPCMTFQLNSGWKWYYSVETVLHIWILIFSWASYMW